MRSFISRAFTFCIAVIAMGWCSSMSAAETNVDLQKSAMEAVSENPEISKPAIAALRDAGPAGFAALEKAHHDSFEQHRKETISDDVDPAWRRLKMALDAVSGQRDCHASHLYWYTDLEAAKRAAKESGKPILSLRLLGKLTDEFSCANSRFFRSTLYANEEVSRVLRERFILHWESVRPVPKVTIDFGDGRKLERTLTGNSIHYILDSDGHVVDALPGLYGPKAFLRGLADAQEILATAKYSDCVSDDSVLRECHASKSKEILAQWQNDLEQLGLMASAGQSAPPEAGAAGPPRAVQANNIAGPKSSVETPILAASLATESSTVGALSKRPGAVAANKRALTKADSETAILAGALADPTELTAKTDDSTWPRIAQLHASDAELDAASVAFIRSKNPIAGVAGTRAMTKRLVEDPMLRMVRSFQNTVGIDTVRNQYTFRRQIHEWFANGEMPVDVDVNALNERVYAQLFLTPSSDPWLGLIPGDVYTALDNNGVVQH
jgi:hypothetical protein